MKINAENIPYNHGKNIGEVLLTSSAKYLGIIVYTEKQLEIYPITLRPESFLAPIFFQPIAENSTKMRVPLPAHYIAFCS
jgi:hypothetical protein